MKNYIKKSVWGASTLLFALQLQAATVDIVWKEPGTYRDIRAGNQSQSGFEEKVTSALGGFFADAAKRLPADQTLHLTITDVDLAGDVEYFFVDFPQGIRVMRDLYFPSISFTYELKDAVGNVIQSGEENIKDMGYLFSGGYFVNDPPFSYEKELIDHWFKKTFK